MTHAAPTAGILALAAMIGAGTTIPSPAADQGRAARPEASRASAASGHRADGSLLPGRHELRPGRVLTITLGQGSGLP